jgi:hypothetical protein
MHLHEHVLTSGHRLGGGAIDDDDGSDDWPRCVAWSRYLSCFALPFPVDPLLIYNILHTTHIIQPTAFACSSMACSVDSLATEPAARNRGQREFLARVALLAPNMDNTMRRRCRYITTISSRFVSLRACTQTQRCAAVLAAKKHKMAMKVEQARAALKLVLHGYPGFCQ